MTYLEQYAPRPASVGEIREFWSGQVDALERHLSTQTWILAAITVLLIAYPLGRLMIPAVLHIAVPDVVRSVLSFI